MKDPLFDPSCCNYRLSKKIRKHVEQLAISEDVNKDIKSVLVNLIDSSNKNVLSYESLTKLHKYIQRADPEYTDPFYILQESCKCIPPKQRENKELETRLKQLRLRSSQSMYNNMTACVDRVVENKMEEQVTDDSKKELRKLNGSLMAVINSFLVYICTFIFCYKALEYALPQPNVIGQVLFGLLGSTIVACAELYFLVRVI